MRRCRVGIPARSLANLRCGGTTRLSNLLHAVFLLMLAGFGSGLIARIPLAALAGVTAYVGLSLLEWSTWRRLPRMRRLDAAAFLAPPPPCSRRTPSPPWRSAARSMSSGNSPSELFTPLTESAGDRPSQRRFVMSGELMLASNVTFFKTPAEFRK